MMENIYSRRVLNFKNKYGNGVCAIAEEKNGSLNVVPKGADISKSYIATKDGRYIEGVKEKNGYYFSENFGNVRAFILGEFQPNGELKPYSYVAYTGDRFEIINNSHVEEKNEAQKENKELKEENNNFETEELTPTESEVFEETERTAIKSEEEEYIPKEESKEENKVFKNNVIEEYEKAKNENWAEKRHKNIIKTFENEMKELENIGVIKKEDLYYIDKGIVNKEESAVDKLFKENTKIYPFENSEYDWVAVSSNEIWRAGINNNKTVRNPLVMVGEIKYNHLALGRNKVTGKLIFAVPEKFDERDKKEAMDAGFKDFWFCNQGKNNFGYWIMGI